MGQIFGEGQGHCWWSPSVQVPVLGTGP